MQDDQNYEDVVRQAQVADETERRRLLDALIGQFAEAALHWARLVLEDEELASDAVQEAWLNAYLHFDQLREGAAFPGWFRQIVTSASYHALRREKPAVPLTEQVPEPTESQSDPVKEIESKEREARIREAVQTLPEGERLVTELFYFADYPQQEIAEVLAVPVTTVKKRLQYARRRLKTLIQPDIVSQLNTYALNGGCTAEALGEMADLMLEWSASPTSVAIMQPIAAL